jgi:hypothetical protein
MGRLLESTPHARRMRKATQVKDAHPAVMAWVGPGK